MDVKVTELPEQIAVLLTDAVTVGLVFTVTVGLVPVPVQPFASLTVTLYVPDAAGTAVVVMLLVLFTTPEPVQM